MTYTQHGGTESTEVTEKSNNGGETVASLSVRCVLIVSDKRTYTLPKNIYYSFLCVLRASVLGIDA